MLRDQSAEVPRRRICRSMMSPDCAFHCHTRSMKASRPSESRVSPLPSIARLRDTTISVAMPAWSVPTCHSVSNPRMRWYEPAHHQRLLERMAHVQGAGDVRRRQQDRIRLALAGRREYPAGFPLRVEPGFEGGGVVAGSECHHMSYLLSSKPRVL